MGDRSRLDLAARPGLSHSSLVAIKSALIEARKLFEDDCCTVEPGPLFTSHPALICMFPPGAVITSLENASAKFDGVQDRPGAPHLHAAIETPPATLHHDADGEKNKIIVHPAIVEEISRRVRALHEHLSGGAAVAAAALHDAQSSAADGWQLRNDGNAGYTQQAEPRNTRKRARNSAPKGPAYTERDFEWSYPGRGSRLGPRAQSQYSSMEQPYEHDDGEGMTDLGSRLDSWPGASGWAPSWTSRAGRAVEGRRKRRVPVGAVLIRAEGKAEWEAQGGEEEEASAAQDEVCAGEVGHTQAGPPEPEVHATQEDTDTHAAPPLTSALPPSSTLMASPPLNGKSGACTAHASGEDAHADLGTAQWLSTGLAGGLAGLAGLDFVSLGSGLGIGTSLASLTEDATSTFSGFAVALGSGTGAANPSMETGDFPQSIITGGHLLKSRSNAMPKDSTSSPDGGRSGSGRGRGGGQKRRHVSLRQLRDAGGGTAGVQAQAAAYAFGLAQATVHIAQAAAAFSHGVIPHSRNGFSALSAAAPVLVPQQDLLASVFAAGPDQINVHAAAAEQREGGPTSPTTRSPTTVSSAAQEVGVVGNAAAVTSVEAAEVPSTQRGASRSRHTKIGRGGGGSGSPASLAKIKSGMSPVVLGAAGHLPHAHGGIDSIRVPVDAGRAPFMPVSVLSTDGDGLSSGGAGAENQSAHTVSQPHGL